MLVTEQISYWQEEGKLRNIKKLTYDLRPQEEKIRKEINISILSDKYNL